MWNLAQLREKFVRLGNTIAQIRHCRWFGWNRFQLCVENLSDASLKAIPGTNIALRPSFDLRALLLSTLLVTLSWFFFALFEPQELSTLMFLRWCFEDKGHKLDFQLFLIPCPTFCYYFCFNSFVVLHFLLFFILLHLLTWRTRLFLITMLGRDLQVALEDEQIAIHEDHINPASVHQELEHLVMNEQEVRKHKKKTIKVLAWSFGIGFLITVLEANQFKWVKDTAHCLHVLGHGFAFFELILILCLGEYSHGGAAAIQTFGNNMENQADPPTARTINNIRATSKRLELENQHGKKERLQQAIRRLTRYSQDNDLDDEMMNNFNNMFPEEPVGQDAGHVNNDIHAVPPVIPDDDNNREHADADAEGDVFHDSLEEQLDDEQLNVVEGAEPFNADDILEEIGALWGVDEGDEMM